MTDTATVMFSGEREQAIRLYALHHDDRAWLLSQMPELVCQRLNHLLQELADLGFEPDSLRDSAEEWPVSPEAGIDESFHRLDQASSRWLFAQLVKEPAPLTLALLQAHPWRWRSEVEALLASRPLAQREPGTIKASPRVQETLIAILVRRMSKDPAACLTASEDAAPALSERTGQWPLLSVLRQRIVGRKPWRR